MSDTMRELADLSLQLNSESDTINSTIRTLNQKLQTLNIGVEVWLDDPLVRSLPGDMPRDQIGPFLGYCNVENEWQLAVRGRPAPTPWQPITVDGTTNWIGDLSRTPLTKSPRENRIAALEQLPIIVERLKAEAERIVRAIREAKALCSQSLTMDKSDIRAYVLKTLATRFEDRNPRRTHATFTPSTPEEEKPLSEVLAELRAEGSVSEFVGTYQFTPKGYDKYRVQIELLRTTG